MVEKFIGRFTLDSLQIFFAWDDDLYTYLKKFGFKKGQVLPIIYTDNCESTKGLKEMQRKNVIIPSAFGKTYQELGWKETGKKTQPIIPSEKPEVEIFIIDKHMPNPKLKFRFIPTVNGKEQYHLEYSSMAAFGRMYGNWVAFYFTPKDFLDILLEILETLEIETKPIDINIITETKQRQREEINYVELKVFTYKFCLESFKFMKDYFLKLGVTANLPCLFYDSNDSDCKALMSPVLKLGVVHTREKNGFEKRKPQIVGKLAQPKIVIIANRRKKVKGKIIQEKKHENFIIIDAKEFALKANRLLGWFTSTYKIEL